MKMKIWECKIGEVDAARLPRGSDAPMRQAVQRAYRELTGEWPEFTFSGWGGELTEAERAVVEDRVPGPLAAGPGGSGSTRGASGATEVGSVPWTATRDGPRTQEPCDEFVSSPLGPLCRRCQWYATEHEKRR